MVDTQTYVPELLLYPTAANIVPLADPAIEFHEYGEPGKLLVVQVNPAFVVVKRTGGIMADNVFPSAVAKTLGLKEPI